jgi:hypothetical protein
MDAFLNKGNMKAIVYFTGREETEKEANILNKLGTRQIDDGYNFPLWEIEFNTLEGLFNTAKKLRLISFKAYLPNVNGDDPLIEFCLDKKEK